MAFTPTEEALLKLLADQNAALLNLAAVEPTIISKLGATKVTLSDLDSVTAPDDEDVMLARQGSDDKSIALSLLKSYITIDEYTDADALAWFESYGKSLATNGYQKLPSGLIIQWGAVEVSANATVTVTLPISFPNYLLNASATFNQQDTATSSGYISAFIASSSQIAVSNAVAASKSAFWFAIGY